MKAFFAHKKSLWLLALLPVVAALFCLPLMSSAEDNVPASPAEPPLSSPVINVSQTAILMPSVFGDNMVLQRDREIRIFGTFGEEGAVIFGTLGNQTAETTVSEGSWELVFPSMQAARGLTLTVSAPGSTVPDVAFKNVDIGEVWLACGQSNMELGLSALPDADEYFNNASDYENIRLFYRGNIAAMEESEPLRGKWSTTKDRETLRRSSAIGYIFATELADAMPDVTVALVDANYYGTSIYSWLNAETLEDGFSAKYTTYLTEYQKFSNGEETSTEIRHVPSGCYNATIAPLAGISARGVLWYQGESNSGDPEAYENAFSALVSLYREVFRNPDLSFYTFQLTPYPSKNYGTFRTAQFQIAEENEGVYLLSTNFFGPTYSKADNLRVSEDYHIHPTKKAEIAIYCARLALAEEYGIGTEKIYKAPELVSLTASGATVTLTFDSDIKLYFGNNPTGFYIYGGSVKYPAKATFSGRTVTLTSSCTVPTGVAYGIDQIQIECKDGRILTDITSDAVSQDRLTTTVSYGEGTAVFRAGESEATRSTTGGNLTNQSGVPLPSFYVDMNGKAQLLPSP